MLMNAVAEETLSLKASRRRRSPCSARPLENMSGSSDGREIFLPEAICCWARVMSQRDRDVRLRNPCVIRFSVTLMTISYRVSSVWSISSAVEISWAAAWYERWKRSRFAPSSSRDTPEIDSRCARKLSTTMRWPSARSSE